MVNSPKKKCFLRLEWLEARDCPTAGALDTTFGGTGIVLTDFSTMADQGMSVAIQPDGKTVVAGRSQQPWLPATKKQPAQNQNLFSLVRYNVDGSLDPSFGSGGKVLTSFGSGTNAYNTSVAIQPDGKIVAAGTVDGKIALARYNTNGSLDTSFDSDGKVTTLIPGNNSNQQTGQIGMVLLPDGKIMLGGRWRSNSGNSGGFALVRYNANGSLDTTFDGDGIALPAITTNYGNIYYPDCMALQDDGKIILAGSIQFTTSIIAQYNANGSLDTTFGSGDGHVEFTGCKFWNDVCLQSGRIVVVGSRPSSGSEPTRPVIARYDSAGALDPTFGVGGLVVETSRQFPATYHAVAIQADGKIVTSGSTGTANGSGMIANAFMVARYSADGSLDTSSFGTDGIVVTDIVVTTELLGDTSEDIVIQTDGRIVVAGSVIDESLNMLFAVTRYLGDNNLSAAAAAPASSSAPSLKLTQAQPLLTEAIRRWRSAGFNVTSLSNINLRIADLPGTIIGQAQGKTTTLDTNAAGWGWFVDKTPRSDSKFRMRGNQGEQERMDLLSVLMHEMGHVLRMDHQHSGVTADTLFAGVRLFPPISSNHSAWSGVK